jgi:quercetin dioxygenase-like cupin family protein
MILQAPYMPSHSVHSAVTGALRVLLQATTPDARREAIAALEEAMAACPQVEQPLTHHFVDGLYSREILNPKGSVIVTQTHKEGNISFIPIGHILVVSEEGHKELKGGMWFATQPGTKRFIYAVEDTRFVTVHPNPTNCQDIEVLESRIASRGNK